MIVSAAFALFLSASETTVVRVNEDLAHYWRTTYDIVVRPPGYRSEVEEKYQLVQPNYLLRIPGGITFAQYEAIRNIPGVEIAAPVAALGYWNVNITLPITQSLPGYVYALRCIYKEQTGTYVLGYDHQVYYVNISESRSPRILINMTRLPECNFLLKGMLAGVDPDAEEALVGLSHALVKGEALRETPISFIPSASPPISDTASLTTLTGIPSLPVTVTEKFLALASEEIIAVPAIMNLTPMVSFTLIAQAVPVQVPSGIEIEDILQRGGSFYLDTLPRQETVVAQATMSSEEIYPRLPEMVGPTMAGLIRELSIPGNCIRYRSLSLPRSFYKSLTLDVERITPCESVSRPIRPFQYDLVGFFKSEKLGLSTEGVSAVPVELYIPPYATLLYDEDGNPVQPQVLRPSTPWTTTTPIYIHPPPLLLTTIEAARAIAGDDCISAIRVRVA
ncbi:MAG: hypothetical protein ACPLYD_16315, partial [Anaerolineae bacterium]